MFFLLRTAFWLGVVCILLPSGGEKAVSADTQIDAKQAIGLANAAVSDAKGFCDRQPDACAVGGKVAVALGHKAEAGARTLYEFISTKLSESSEADRKPITKKTLENSNVAMGLTADLGHGTLTSGDLKPSWHAPVPLPTPR